VPATLVLDLKGTASGEWIFSYFRYAAVGKALALLQAEL
jgi:hypothetical protein